MNSTQLKKDHADVYRDFFDAYDLVLSLPMSVYLTGRLWITTDKNSCFGHMVPHRVYMGMNDKKPSGEIECVTKPSINEPFTYHFNGHNGIASHRKLSQMGKDSTREIGILNEYDRLFGWFVYFLYHMCHWLFESTIDLTSLKDTSDSNQDLWDVITNISALYIKYSDFFTTNLGGIYKEYAYIHSAIFDGQFYSYQQDKLDYNYSFFSTWSKANRFKSYIISHDASVFWWERGLNVSELHTMAKSYAAQRWNWYDESFIHAVNWIDEYYLSQLLKHFDLYINNRKQGNDFFRYLQQYEHIHIDLLNNDDRYKFRENNIPERLTQWHRYWWRFTHRICLIWEESLDITQEHIDKLNKETDYNFCIEYRSDRDGYEEKWLKVEQRKSQWIFADLPNKQTVSWWWDNAIIIDSLEQKIYINGQKLTSHDLHSQSATVELLLFLLTKDSQRINNSELPQSTYSRNKNQLVSKIISPLKKVIKTKLWIELKILCKWSLYDFALYFSITDTAITVR